MTKRGRGRPTVGERVALGLRVTHEMKRKLDAAAERNGRSQSAEAEFRLGHTFAPYQGLVLGTLTLVYGEEIAAILMGMGELMKQAELMGEPPAPTTNTGETTDKTA